MPIWLLWLLRGLGQLIGQGLRTSKAQGLTEDLVRIALEKVTEAEFLFPTGGKRRDWVVRLLLKEGVPERVARLALELAYSAFKDGVRPG